MVNGKRIKETFQVVYDYRTQEWVFNYAKGMSGAKTFAGYRIGNELVGDAFASMLTLSAYSIKLGGQKPVEPDAPIEPPTLPIPPITTPTAKWGLMYEWEDINFEYQLRRRLR